MDAFWDLYSKEGIEKTSVREIVSKAGYNRSTFYEYFTDVYDVLEQIEASVLPDIEKHQDTITKTGVHLPVKHLTEVYSLNKSILLSYWGKTAIPLFKKRLKTYTKNLYDRTFNHSVRMISNWNVRWNI